MPTDSDKPDKLPHRPKAPPPKEKTFQLEMRDKPWKQVLEWYADISGLPFVGNSTPSGTFTFLARGAKIGRAHV